MTEQELYEKIRSSAEEIEIPESISPENMKKRLDAMASENEKASKKIGGYRGITKKMIAAAAMLIVCTAGVSTLYQAGSQRQGAASGMNMTEGAYEEAAGESVQKASGTIEGAESSAYSMDGAERIKKSDAGNLYTVAEGYGDLYDLLKKRKNEDLRYDLFTWGKEEIALEDSAGVESSAAAGASMETQQETAYVEEAIQTEGYSKTNLQMEGVDESDIIKTDGSYVYILHHDIVKVVAIGNEEMKVISEIEAKLGGAADNIAEMYVDGDVLNLIIEREETELKQQTGQSGEKKLRSLAEKIAVNDVYEMDSRQVTELLTYDISDRENPKLTGSMTQDGYYKDSRKIGDIVYLFTEIYMQMPELTRNEAVEEQAGSWIPLVNGSIVEADCIYLPKEGENGLLLSSVNVERPDTVVDNILILNDYVNIYVSTSALYLYGTGYSGSGAVTEIAKFSLEKGIINAAGACSAAGEVYDTFAINEYQGKLRLLTTDWSGEEENQLYLFDEKLKLTGSLKGIAKGEQIYSARYLGDIVYFVTYRNTDPLFAVDLSDEKKPRILSELKITGFSEYLHFWGKDKLVGIGYETDPDTGEQKGLKLSMFDISDPAELKIAGTCVIRNADYSPALYNYKCVLVDKGENLIGFLADDYLLFSWENGSFKKLMTESADDNVVAESYRGIYAGERFYLVNADSIASYDRENGYELIQKLEL